MSQHITRRGFIAAATSAGVALRLNAARGAEAVAKPALLGGKPAFTGSFSSWPIIDDLEEKALLKVLRSGRWYRGSGETVDRFEKAYSRITDSKHCVATANGTGALLTALSALGVGPGDEVILPPYTFVATLNVILEHHAMPIFVDTDRETFQIDAAKIEAAVSDRTVAIMPVHLGGAAADMDAILKISKKHKIPVVEDACQAHLAQWRGQAVGTLGDAGCFSFQASKNLNSGEGGSILCQDDELAAKCYAMHNNCRARSTESYDFSYWPGRAINLRLTEFQAGLLLAQMTRLEAQSKTREENASYLTGMLKEIPGITPAKMYEGCTRNAYHLYMFRYDPKEFAGMSRAKFQQALAAEGVAASSGYGPLNEESFITEILNGRSYKRVYPEKQLRDWKERNRCPENNALCEEAVWFTQTMFLGPRRDMEQIAEAVRKIRAHAGELAKA
jgi:dTDP-4-amino-4,6-dideoxygalactose transaminase